MTVGENFSLDLDDEEDFGYQEIKDVSKNLSQTYFERGEPENKVDDLSTMYAILADDSGKFQGCLESSRHLEAVYFCLFVMLSFVVFNL